MFIYFVYLVILLVLLLLERTSRKGKYLIRTIIPLVFTCFIGFRGISVGVDTENYVDHYYRHGLYGADYVEKGFDWINRWLYAQGFSAHIFLFVLSAIAVLFLTLSIRKKEGSEYTIAALCLYLLTFSYLINSVRQGIAAAILFFSTEFIEKKKLVIFLLLILLGSLFHASVLLMIPVYFFAQLKLDNLVYVFIYLISFSGLFIDLSQFIPSFQLFGRDYSIYIDHLRIEDASPLGYIITTTLYVIVFFLMLNHNIFKKYPVIANLTFIYFVLRNLSFSLPIVLGRIAGYFPWFIFLVYSILFNKEERSQFNSVWLAASIIIVFNAVLWIHSLLSPANMQIPYLFFWQQ